MSYIGFNDSGRVQILDNNIGTQMLDKFSRIKTARQTKPLEQEDNIVYEHRALYDTYNLLIGDVYLLVPPEFIMVTSESTTQSIVTLRQENTQKAKSGYHRRSILIDLVFNSIEEINGFRVESPETLNSDNGHYYVDGLRQLLAQFKCTPFLPITNEFINGTYGIFAVALQSIVISTIEGFPSALKAQITLQEVNMFPYLQMPDMCFKYMIDWDLFRDYYQSFLTEVYEYKHLQSLPANVEHNHFKLKIIDSDIFSNENYRISEYNILDIITDKKILRKDEDGNEADSNFETVVDSNTSDAVITSFQCGYSNLLTNIQLADMSSPTLQFMGGMDTMFNIVIETMDENIVKAIEQCQIKNDLITRANPKIKSSIGFVRLESDLVAFTGSLFVMIDNVTTNTIPGFPGLYNIQMNCIAYDLAQSKRESLNGFKPFPCDADDCKNNNFHPDHIHSEQAIAQNGPGLWKKIKQDCYAEWKLRTGIEVYPDLRLPFYLEVNYTIKKIKEFRAKHNLTQLPYDVYPLAPAIGIEGLNPYNPTTIKYADEGLNIVSLKSVDNTRVEYDGYVDPDFYVFYPCSYNSFLQDDESYYDGVSLSSFDATTKKKKVVNVDNYTETQAGSVPNPEANYNLSNQFCELACSFVGNSVYVWGEKGSKNHQGQYKFDCSGLVTYCLIELEGIPANIRLTCSSIQNHPDYLLQVNLSELKRGDIIVNTKKAHMGIYLGNNKLVHCTSANNKNTRVETLDEAGFTIGTAWRVKKFIDVKESCEVTVEKTTTTKQPSIEERTSVTEVVNKAYAIISSNEGNYTSVNKNDNGALSIGVIQWHANRALGLLNIIVQKTPVKAEQILGSKLYKEITNPSTNWSNRIVSQDEANKISSLLGTQEGIDAQEGLRKTDIRGYIEAAMSWGITDMNALVYLADGINQYGFSDWKTVALKALENGGDLDAVHEAAKKYKSGFKSHEIRRNAVYNALKGNNIPDVTKPTGKDPEYVDTSMDYTISYVDFDMICRVIMSLTMSENVETVTHGKNSTEVAMAQVIYDRLISRNFGTLAHIINDATGGFGNIYQGELNDTIEEHVKQVFCEGKRYWYKYRVFYFANISEADSIAFEDRDKEYERLKEVGNYVFWAKKQDSGDVKFRIADETYTGYSEEEYTINHEVFTITDASLFGEPVIVDTGAMRDRQNEAFFREQVNSTDNIFNSSFCDEHRYSARGRLVKAFPTYLFCILDDNAQWYDGRKLWTNYYTHRSVVDIAVHAANDMPTETATITVTNSYHNLDRIQGGLSEYSIRDELKDNKFALFMYEEFGMRPGFGPKLTDKLIELHQVIYKHALLREGARIHLRMGYGSDPLSLAPVMNGHVSDVALGDQITVVVTSDGHELIQHIVGVKEKESNNGWLGLFGLGEAQESSNIISKIMCARNSWLNYLAHGAFDWESSKFSIEHYGLFRNQKGMGQILTDGFQEAFEVVTGVDTNKEIDENLAIFGSGVEDYDYLQGYQDLTGVGDLFNEYCEQYDILKNIYRANYRRQSYHYTALHDGELEKETNLVFNSYNMTPWDIFQMCTQHVPEYIVKTSYHQFDSRLYFGLPFWMEKCKYVMINGVVFEECKSSTQVHFLDSMENIIDNQIRVTSKYSHTNVKVMYIRGSDAVTTGVIHSDDTIDASKQKTKILDTSIVQDAFGPDFVYEIGLYALGKNAARRIGISNLLQGWEMQYQGQIILLGSPGIKPYDYIMINDTYSNMVGLAKVREVIHSFNTNTGFTTSVVPGLIGFSTDENSGLIETCQNYLGVLAAFSGYTRTRREMLYLYEKELGILSDVQTLLSSIQVEYLSGRTNIASVINVGTSTFSTMSAGYLVFIAIRKIRNIIKSKAYLDAIVDFATVSWSAAKAAYAGFRAYKGVKLLRRTVSALRSASAAIGGTVVPALICFGVSILLDSLVGAIEEYIKNKNVCTLLPLWWEDYPFVSGVKDGEHILLIPNNATATEQNTGGDPIVLEEDAYSEQFTSSPVEDN